MFLLLRFLFIQALSLLFISQAFSLNPNIPVYTLLEVDIFKGDSHGEFKNDPVAVLSDYSAWKIHPNDKELFTHWDPNDVIQVCKRTSFYWFKREHKFELYNHTKNESVRTMIVQYPTYPTYIESTDTYVVDSWLRTHSWIDAYGVRHVHYYTVDVYEKLIYLSNGKSCIIKNQSSFPYFNVNNYVYIGYNVDKDGTTPFMISGTEREAKWAWVFSSVY